MIDGMVIRSKTEDGTVLEVELNSTEATYILQYIKDLGHLYYYLDYVVKRWKRK